MRRFFASRDKTSGHISSDSEWGGDILSASDARKAKLAFATLLIFLLTITISYEWNGRARLIDRAQRETFLGDLEKLGEQCIAEEEYLEAIIVFETLLEASPGSPTADETLCRVGLCWICLENADAAIEAWERFLRLYPDSKHASRVRQSYLSIMKDRLRGLSV